MTPPPDSQPPRQAQGGGVIQSFHPAANPLLLLGKGKEEEKKKKKKKQDPPQFHRPPTKRAPEKKEKTFKFPHPVFAHQAAQLHGSVPAPGQRDPFRLRPILPPRQIPKRRRKKKKRKRRRRKRKGKKRRKTMFVEVDPRSMSVVGTLFRGYHLTKTLAKAAGRRCFMKDKAAMVAAVTLPPLLPTLQVPPSEIIWNAPPPGVSTPAFGIWSEVAYMKGGGAIVGTNPLAVTTATTISSRSITTRTPVAMETVDLHLDDEEWKDKPGMDVQLQEEEEEA